MNFIKCFKMMLVADDWKIVNHSGSIEVDHKYGYYFNHAPGLVVLRYEYIDEWDNSVYTPGILVWPIFNILGRILYWRIKK